MRNATASTTDSIANITSVIRQINNNAPNIATAAEEQIVSMQEISPNVQQAAEDTQQVVKNMGGVRQASEYSGASASEVWPMVGELSRKFEILRREVDQFISGLRVA